MKVELTADFHDGSRLHKKGAVIELPPGVKAPSSAKPVRQRKQVSKKPKET